ncbi:MAG: 50S ribosomal protein L3 [Holosporales bacterium]|jgi:large subunit ribosomal protein L3|nr:50S ribosomal protein L3 [Holosporales bacterium]
MRTGVVAKKIGMTRIFSADGVSVPVTVLQVDECVVLEQKTMSRDGYDAVKLGAGQTRVSKLSRAVRCIYSSKDLEPRAMMKEFRVTSDGLLDVGTLIRVDHFSSGQLVDVTGISIGKGFAGVIKRHGFGGLRATHGVSLSHRSHGSVGNRTKPGRIFKNKRMAGHLGNVKVTTLNLTVHGIDNARGLLFLRGSVPGPKNGIVFVRDAIKAASVKVGGEVVL